MNYGDDDTIYTKRGAAPVSRSTYGPEVLRRAVAKGCLISIGRRDGDWIVKRTTDYLKVMEAVMKTGGRPFINIRDRDGALVGTMVLTNREVTLYTGIGIAALIVGE